MKKKKRKSKNIRVGQTKHYLLQHPCININLYLKSNY